MASDIRLADSDAEIRRCHAVMRQLRPHLTEEDFLAQARRQMAEQNWRLVCLEEGGAIAAASGFRILECMATGKTLYVDDLVTAEDKRSQGFGERLMAWMEAHARDQGCRTFSLDSGTQRTGAHKFYFRLGLPIVSFHFARSL